MPVLKITHGNRSAKMIDYLFSQDKESGRLQAVGGNVAGRDPVSVEGDFQDTRNYFEEQGDRQYYHVALSFERSDLGDMALPDGKPDYERIRDYGEEWAREAGVASNYDYLVVVHGEKEHPHAHVVWNATSYDGRKYHDDKHNLDRLRDVNDKLARDHGIKRELDRVRDPHRPSDKFIRQAQRGGDRYSWKLDMQDRVHKAACRALSEEDFKKRLEQRDVNLRIRGGKYSYSMLDAQNKRRTIREGRLGESYQRANLVEKFTNQREQLLRDPRGYERRLKQEEEGRYSWQRDLRSRITEALKTSRDHESFKDKLGREGVSACQGEQGRYRFTFEDRHGLPHSEVPAERLYSRNPDRIAERLQENAGREDLLERAVPVDLSKAAGREASGLVTRIMREVEDTTRDPYGARDFGGPPTREDLRYERPRRHAGHEDSEEHW